LARLLAATEACVLAFAAFVATPAVVEEPTEEVAMMIYPPAISSSN